MNNPKMFNKVISVALVLAMLVSSFSLLTLGTSAEGSGFMDVTQNGDEFAYTYVCDDCGETVTVPAELLKSYSDFTTTGATKAQGLPTSVQGADKDPYRIDFAVEVIEVPDDQALLTALYNSNSGRNVLNYSGTESGQNGTKNPATLRQFPVSDGNGSYKTDEIEIKISNGANNDGDNYTSLGTVKEDESMDITLICTPASSLIEVYADGVYVGTRTSEQSFRLQNIRFFDGATNGAATLKISGLKVIRSGEDTHAKSCVPVTAEPFEGCWHAPAELGLITPMKDGDRLYYTYECANCGEMVDADLVSLKNNKGEDYGDININGNQNEFVIPAGLVGADADPYQVNFTITLNAMPEDISAMVNGSVGRSFLNYKDSSSTPALLRQLIVAGASDKLEIACSDGSQIAFSVATMTVGDTIELAFVCNPAKSTIDIYVDGTYMGTRTSADSFKRTNMRFGDRSGTGAFKFENITFIQPVAESHKHTYNWDGADNVLTLLDNNTINYDFTCYCGETFTAGIKAVLEDAIAPMYNTESASTLLTLPEIADTKIAAFVGNMAIKTLPAEGVKALVSFGETAVMSIDADGVVYVGEAATKLVLAENAADYKSFAFYLSLGTCTVYFEGEKLGSVEYSAESDVVIGSEDMGTVHFDSMALAILALGANGTYEVVENDHEHSFDDIRKLFLATNEARTSITATYDCIICGRPAALGISANLYDDASTDEVEAIPSIMDTAKGTVILDGISEYADGSYWFSADFVVNTYVRYNCQPIVSLGDTAILLLDADGTITLSDKEYTEVASVELGERFNVSFNVEVDGEKTNVIVFFNGEYCGEYALDVAPEAITAGGEKAPSYTVDAIKLMTIGVGGTVEIENFACDAHVYDYSAAVIEYSDNTTFTVTNKCLACGLTVVEKPVHSLYEGAMPAIYNGVGTIKLPFADSEKAYDSFWTVLDVNARNDEIGSFVGYKSLVAIGGYSVVLVNADLALAFGNGASMNVSLDAKSTNNIAVQIVGGVTANVYVDGVYVGSVDIDKLAQIESDENHVFGEAGLEDILFYNIRSFVAAAKGEFVTFEHEDVKLTDCLHEIGDAERKTIKLIGSDLEYSYSCSVCGQTVFAKAEGQNLYDAGLNAANKSGFVFDENGKTVLEGRKYILYDTDLIGVGKNSFWLSFDLTLLDILFSSGNKNLLDIRSNYEQALRLHYDNSDEYLLLKVRASAIEAGRLYLNETNNIAVFVDASTDTGYAYFNGEYVGSTTGFIGTDASKFNGQIRLLGDGIAGFEISNFHFVADAASHTHTDAKSEEMGVAPTVKYGDTTLEYTFKCICGEIVTAGIDEIYEDQIANLTGVTEATAMENLADVNMPNKPYWVSSKVYVSGDTAVYSYGETEIVGVSDGVYTVGGAATALVPAGIKLAGDYDVISVQIAPADGAAYVYINGKCVGTVALDIDDYTNFDVLLGGGAAADFKLIKVVSLAVGANKEVTPPVCVHEFGYNADVVAEITDTGIVYKYDCKACGTDGIVLRTVEIGNGPIISKNTLNTTGTADSQITIPTANNGVLFGSAIGDKFFVTTELTATNLDNVTASEHKGVISWVGKTGTAFYGHFFRLQKINGENRILLGQDVNNKTVTTDAVIELNKTYKLVFELEYTHYDDAKARAMCTIYAYLDGRYIGKVENIPFMASGTTGYVIRLNGGCGTVKYDNFKLYNPQTDELVTSAPETPDDGGNTPVEPPKACVHFPDVNAELSKTIDVKDGVIKHVFTCKNCGEDVTLETMSKIVDGNFDSMLAGVSSSQYITLGDKVAKGTAPFIVSFDLSADVINLDTIIATGTKGKSLSAIQSLGADGKANGWAHLVRAFGHVCECADETHEDKDGDGFADGVIELRCLNNKANSNPVLAVMGISDTVNLTYVIDATNFTIEIYVNGTYKHTSNSVNIASDDICVRVGESDIGSFDFDNLRIVRMTDICEHVGPSCKDGAFGKCANCDVVVEATHNYVAQTDRTGMWTKYTCGDCGTHYVVFNDMSLVANLTFATKSELLNYLTQTYYPVF